MLKRIHELLDQADVVVHYNGTSFDIPCLNKEFLIYGFSPPAPYKQMDLLKTARSQFRFTSNKLDYVCQKLKLGKKSQTDFTLWVDCMDLDPDAWEKMEEYNKNDVLLLEKLYTTLRPWIKQHPNYGLYKSTTGLVCPHCGSLRYQKRGFQYTAAYKYQRYQCRDCKTWFRGSDNIGFKKGEKFNNV